MKVSTLPRFIMNAGEVLTTASRIETLLKKAPAEDTFLHEMLRDLADQTAPVREVYYSDRGARVRTASLNAARAALNERLSSTGKFLRGLRYSPDGAVADAASSMYALLKAHQLGARGRNREIQSATVGSMLRRLAEPAVSALLDAAGARAAFEGVAGAYQEFERIHRENLAAGRKRPRMKALLAPVRQSLLDIIGYVNTRGRRSPKAYGRLSASVNSLVVTVGSKARARRTRKRTSAMQVLHTVGEQEPAAPKQEPAPTKRAHNRPKTKKRARSAGSAGARPKPSGKAAEPG